MYCPKCKCQFIEGISICPDCQVELVEQLPQDSIEGSDEFEAVKLISTSNNIESDMIIDLLTNNDIPSFKKSKGSGGYMNIYMGYSIYGEDIFIARTDYQKAKALLSELELELEPEKLEENINEDTHIPFYRNKKIIARIILIFIVLLYLLIYAFQKLF